MVVRKFGSVVNSGWWWGSEVVEEGGGNKGKFKQVGGIAG
jgi:hypothetical protein